MRTAPPGRSASRFPTRDRSSTTVGPGRCRLPTHHRAHRHRWQWPDPAPMPLPPARRSKHEKTVPADARCHGYSVECAEDPSERRCCQSKSLTPAAKFLGPNPPAPTDLAKDAPNPPLSVHLKPSLIDANRGTERPHTDTASINWAPVFECPGESEWVESQSFSFARLERLACELDPTERRTQQNIVRSADANEASGDDGRAVHCRLVERPSASAGQRSVRGRRHTLCTCARAKRVRISACQQ